MKLWPRSLLWRSVALIALLLIVAHFAWLQIFRFSEREPRAQQIAQQIVSVINLTRAALITAQPGKRLGLLADISQREGIQVHLGEPNEEVAPLPDLPVVKLIETELQQRLGPDTRFATSRNGIPGVWVSFRIDDDEYWVALPRARLERVEPLRWIGWGILVLALALAGAFLIVSRINRPLRELTRAAEQTGKGSAVAPVAETGPVELQTLARAFNQMTADLKRQEDERALLLAGVSHDLRTPLARIRLGLEMLEDKEDAALKPGMIQDIEDIDAAISQFLDFARTSETETTAPAADLNALVSGVAERRRLAGAKLTLDLGPVPPLQLRTLAIQRLITNLIENAVRHGGGDVRIATGAAADRAFVEVLDRGPGIPPEQAERMLQPFTRLDHARGGAGTGLGLAIVERIARAHGGSIKLTPRHGGGLKARVEIPLDA
ncbi:MAG: ATP-binding protein [Burkholderiales bacterium]|nr:ATP-binding protein [Burkholderiales bacterium]